jgi:hypothetical protein
MSGKLPIDRAREAKFSPKLLERQKQRLSTERAQIREQAAAHEEQEAEAQRAEEAQEKVAREASSDEDEETG